MSSAACLCLYVYGLLLKDDNSCILLLIIADPDPSQYVWDEQTGYYYDHSTGLYYDANSQVSKYIVLLKYYNCKHYAHDFART